ncbi:MAG: DinB family protein [Gemmatimonadota bacterium]|nr:DinB family protein [Gemmatimonadota bacterium]
MGRVKELVLGDIPTELGHTRRLLQAVPDERFDWKPHKKSWHVGGLANHLSQLPVWQAMVLESDGLDLGAMPPSPEAPTSMPAVLAQFEENCARLHAAVDETTDESLSETWTLRMGDHEIMSGPRGVVLRQVGVSHAAHHRGQLTVFLRLLDVEIPQTYGPTADHPGGFG